MRKNQVQAVGNTGVSIGKNGHLYKLVLCSAAGLWRLTSTYAQLYRSFITAFPTAKRVHLPLFTVQLPPFSTPPIKITTKYIN